MHRIFFILLEKYTQMFVIIFSIYKHIGVTCNTRIRKVKINKHKIRLYFGSSLLQFGIGVLILPHCDPI